MRKLSLVLTILIICVSGASAAGPSSPSKMGIIAQKPTPHANPEVVYVNQASIATSPGGASWHTAYPSLAEALVSDLSGKAEIWVARGTYFPTDGTDRNASFTLVPGIGLYGGFRGHETLREQRNWKKYPTIMSGEIGDSDDLSDNVYHVVTGSDDAILDGFTIQDGYAVLAAGDTDDSGSLVAVPEELSGMELLRVVTNVKSSSGAGLLNVHAGTTTRNCTFSNNYASKGGAVYNMVTRSWDPSSMDETVIGETPTFKNCTFENNHASARGGAVNNDFFTSATFVNCTFSNNICDSKGGAVYGDMGCPIYFMNVLFHQNEAERGSALVADGVSSHRLVYATFTENIAYDIGAALYQGTYMGTNDGEPFAGNEVHLYKSVIVGNESESSSSSISNWHDSLATYDDDSIVETVDGTLAIDDYLNPFTYTSKSKQFGWHPRRQVDVEFWAELFDSDANRTYTAYTYNTGSLSGTPGIIYVDTNATGSKDGTSWADAYPSLSSALENAVTGSEVWVAAGTYTPTTGTDRSQTFVMKEGVNIYGGFAGTESDRDDRDPNTHITILSGDIGTEGDPSDNAYHVLFGVTSALLDGFAIQDGYADGDFYHSRGGGLLCYDGASPEIINCTFQNNSAIEGGAIACYGYAAPTIINCIIAENSAQSGGGILFRTGPDSEEMGPRVVNTYVSNNMASDRGGAVYIDYGAWPTFGNCTISGNLSGGNGGGVYVDNNSSQLSTIEARFNSCYFTNNSSEQRGGAISIYEGTVFLDFSKITENSATAGGGGIALDYMGNFVNVADSTTITNNTSTSGENDIDDDSQMNLMPPPMEAGI